MNTLSRRVSVVMLTCNRREEVLCSLANLRASREHVPVHLVDNGCRDGTADAVRASFPEVHIVSLPRNVGAAGRNAGVRAAATPYVAFCDDDTWWAPGSLARAAAVLDACPRLAAVTARVLVGAEEREDDTSRRMAASPLPNELGLPGTQVLGLMAGACMMRREAYLQSGGYEPRLFIGGEELLLALDLMAAGWAMAYVPEVSCTTILRPRAIPGRAAASRIATSSGARGCVVPGAARCRSRCSCCGGACAIPGLRSARCRRSADCPGRCRSAGRSRRTSSRHCSASRRSMRVTGGRSGSARSARAACRHDAAASAGRTPQ